MAKWQLPERASLEYLKKHAVLLEHGADPNAREAGDNTYRCTGPPRAEIERAAGEPGDDADRHIAE